MTWWRYIPTPSYGRYGGSWNHKKGKAIDWMDYAFKMHDFDVSVGLKCADKILVQRLKNGDVQSLSFYGKIYRIFTIKIFENIINITSWRKSNGTYKQ